MLGAFGRWRIFGVLMKSRAWTFASSEAKRCPFTSERAGLVLVVIRPLGWRIPLSAILWLLAGGIAYTTGVLFFVNERLRYGHFVWHSGRPRRHRLSFCGRACLRNLKSAVRPVGTSARARRINWNAAGLSTTIRSTQDSRDFRGQNRGIHARTVRGNANRSDVAVDVVMARISAMLRAGNDPARPANFACDEPGRGRLGGVEKFPRPRSTPHSTGCSSAILFRVTWCCAPRTPQAPDRTTNFGLL